MKRFWLALATASLLVGCSPVQTAKRTDPSQQATSPALTTTTPTESVERLYPDELTQVQSVTVDDYESGAVKSVDDPKLVKLLIDRLREARPALDSPPLDAQGFQYTIWLTLGDRRQIHLILWPDSSKVDLTDPIGGSAWQVSGLSDVMASLLPSSDQDKKYIGRTQAIQIATVGSIGAKVSDVLLVESYHDRGRGQITVWQVQLSGTPAPVIIDATTGEIVDYLQGNASSFVSSVSPNQATVIRARESAEIQVHFQRDMNPSTLNAETIQIVEAKHSRSLTDAYRFEYHDKTLVLRPVNPSFDFGSGNTITITLRGTIQDATGEPMGMDFSWSFRT